MNLWTKSMRTAPRYLLTLTPSYRKFEIKSHQFRGYTAKPKNPIQSVVAPGESWHMCSLSSPSGQLPMLPVPGGRTLHWRYAATGTTRHCYTAVYCSAVQCSAVLSIAVQCSAVQGGEALCMKHLSSLKASATLHYFEEFNSEQYNVKKNIYS